MPSWYYSFISSFFQLWFTFSFFFGTLNFWPLWLFSIIIHNLLLIVASVIHNLLLIVASVLIIADMESNKKLNPILTELSFRGRKLNILLVFISQSYFKVSNTIKLNATHYCIIKIPNKRKLEQTAWNHSSYMDFKDFKKLCKKYTKEPWPILVNDMTLSSDNSLRFRKNLLSVLVRKLKQSTTKLSKLKLNTI